MKVNSKELLSALKAISPAVSTNKIVPILEYVKIECYGEDAVVTATNLKLTCSRKFSLKEKSNDCLLVPFDELEKICSLTTEIEIDKKLKVTFGKEYSKLGVPEDVNLFSLPPSLIDPISFDANADFFYSLSQALKSTASDNSLPTHNVFLEVVSDRTTVFSYGNGALYVNNLSYKSTGSISVPIPPDFIKAVKYMQDSKVEISDRAIRVSDGYNTIISSLADCGILGYDAVYKRDKTPNCILSKNDILSGIYKLEAVRTTANYHQIQLQLSKNEITLTSSDDLINRESKSYCACDNTSDVSEIIFDSSILKSAISQVPSDMLNIKFFDYKMPIAITDGDLAVFVSPMVKI